MDDKSVIISYETLFELLRIERSRTELQELPSSYVDEVRKLIESEQAALHALPDSEKQKKSIHTQNILKIVSEVYERRERKIVGLALTKSKTKSAIIDYSKFLLKEKEMFQDVMHVLDKYRQWNESIVHNLPVKEEMPLSPAPVHIKEEPKSPVETGQSKSMFEELPSNPAQTLCSQAAPSTTVKPGTPIRRETKTVRFVSPVPCFIGPELEEYGPFDEEEITTLPGKIADVLIQKKRAEEIVLSD